VREGSKKKGNQCYKPFERGEDTREESLPIISWLALGKFKVELLKREEIPKMKRRSSAGRDEERRGGIWDMWPWGPFCE